MAVMQVRILYMPKELTAGEQQKNNWKCITKGQFDKCNTSLKS